MSDKKFIPGLRAFTKHENAPDFVVCDLSLEREVLQAWLANENTGERYIKAQLLISQAGAPYVAINDYKPQNQESVTSYQPAPVPPVMSDSPQDDIPF